MAQLRQPAAPLCSLQAELLAAPSPRTATHCKNSSSSARRKHLRGRLCTTPSNHIHLLCLNMSPVSLLRQLLLLPTWDQHTVIFSQSERSASSSALKQEAVPEVVEADRRVGQFLACRHQFVQQVVELPLSVTDGPAVNLGPAQLVPEKPHRQETDAFTHRVHNIQPRTRAESDSTLRTDRGSVQTFILD